MSKTYRPYEPDQQLLLPAALQEWLPSDHLAHFVSDVVDQLDLSPIMARYQSEERGRPSLPSPDDGQGPGLRLLHRSGVLSQDCSSSPRGHRLPGAGGQQHAGLPYYLRLPEGPPGSVGRPVPAGVGTVLEGGPGEAGPCGPGRDQDEGQCIETPGDELRQDEREGSAVGSGSGRVAEAGPGGG